MPVRRLAVIHFTNGATAQSSIDFWKTKGAKGASAHIVIDRNGDIYQVRPFNKTCGHAGPVGKSRWQDPNSGNWHDGLNSCSIGIELANAGADYKTIGRHFASGFIEAAHFSEPGRIQQWEKFPDPQIQSLITLLRMIIIQYSIDGVATHDMVSFDRKDDTGPAFPLKKVLKAIGMPTDPLYYYKSDLTKHILQFNDLK